MASSRTQPAVTQWQQCRCGCTGGSNGCRVDDHAVDHSSLITLMSSAQVKGNFMFDPAAHPDFLGAILGTGEHLATNPITPFCQTFL
jgi:hypothetical protein